MVSNRSSGSNRQNQASMNKKTDSKSSKGVPAWKDEKDEEASYLCSENNSSCSTNKKHDHLKSASNPYCMAQDPDEDEDEEYDDDDDDYDDDESDEDEDEDYDDDEDEEEEEEEEGSHSRGAALHHSHSQKPIKKK